MTRRVVRRAGALAFALLLLPSGCEKPSGRSVEPAKKGSASAAAKRPAAKRPAAKKDPCKDIRARFVALRDKGGTCAKDADCHCYPGGIVDCGGVSDHATTAKLRVLTRLYRLSGCPLGRRCAKRPCIPSCVGGRCARQARAQLP